MSEFVDYLHEVFEQSGRIRGRKMFGGNGIYHDCAMFGLAADESRAMHFEAIALGRFEYEKDGKTIKMSYYLAPDEIFDDPDAASLWARRAYDATLRAKRKHKQ